VIAASSAFLAANAAAVKSPVFVLEIDGYSRKFCNAAGGRAGLGFSPWINTIDTHDVSADDLEGSSTLGDLTVTVLDYQRLLTADMPGFTFEGKKAWLKTGFPGMIYADYVTLFTGVLVDVPMANADSCYQFVARDPRVALQNVIYLTGDDGQATGSDHPKTLLGNPMDLLLSILTDYIGFTDVTDFDGDKIRAYRDEYFAGLLFEFSITSPPAAKDFIESQLMKPLGGYLRVDNLGRITPQFFRPLAGQANIVAALNQNNVTAIPEMQQADLVNVVSFRFDKSDDTGGNSNGFLSETVIIDSVSETKYGQQGQNIIECDGVRSAFQGYLTAGETARAIFGRYGYKNPRIDATTGLWTLCLLELGDLVSLSHPRVPDRTTGLLGISNKVFEVNGRTLDFNACTITLKLVDASGTQFAGRFKIAPDAIADWTAATLAQKQQYMFLTDSTGHYSDGSAGNPLS
jgi:hypothetical protein